MPRRGFISKDFPQSLGQKKALVRSEHRHACYFFKPTHCAEKGVVVYLHGLGGDGTYLTHFLFHGLLASGFEVVCVDLEGHGRDSQGLWRGREEDDQAFCLDLLQFLGGVGVTSFHLVGYSLGGVMACLLALESQRKSQSCVRGLSLLSVPWCLPEGLSWKVLGELSVFSSKLFWKHLYHPGIRRTLPALGPFLRNRYPLRQSISPSGSYSDLAAWIGGRPVQQWLGDLECPILWVEGRYDSIIPPLPTTVVPHGKRFQILRVPSGHLGVLLCSEAIEATVKYFSPSS